MSVNLFDTYQKFKEALIKGSRLPQILQFSGHEHYFIDLFEKLLSDASLDPQDNPYERIALYGPEVEVNDIISVVQTFPMFNSRRLILVREASKVKPTIIKGKDKVTIEDITEYLSDLPRDTFIAFFFKDKEFKPSDKKQWEEVGTFLVESLRFRRQKDLELIIERMAQLHQLQIDSVGIKMITDLIGDDLVAIDSEFSKLEVTTKISSGKILPNMISLLVNQSKEDSAFDLLKAIRLRNREVATRMAVRMGENEKRFPLPMTIAVLYNFFSLLLIYQYNKKRSKTDLIQLIGVKNEYVFREYQEAALKYNAVQIVNIISALRKIDHAYKGVSGVATDPQALYIDLINEILYA